MANSLVSGFPRVWKTLSRESLRISTQKARSWLSYAILHSLGLKSIPILLPNMGSP